MLLKVMVEHLCLRPGPSMDPSRLCAEVSPLVKVHIKGVISMSPDSCIFLYIEKC